MPTVIDSLVVELGLDPKKFTEGQRNATAALRKFEIDSQRTADSVSKSGTNVLSFFRALEHPVSSLKQYFSSLAATTIVTQSHITSLGNRGRQTGAAIAAGAAVGTTRLQALGTQSARTGAEVERNTLKGAAALRVFGIAGLTAFAALEGAKKSLEFSSGVAGRTFGTSVGAASSGTPIQEFSAISRALALHLVPAEQTETWLANFRQSQNRARTWGDPAFIQSLAFATQDQPGVNGAPGVHIPTNLRVNALSDTPEQALIKFARVLTLLPKDIAITRAQQLGLNPVQALGLREAGANLPADIQRAGVGATTPADRAAAMLLLKLQGDLTNSWDALSRKLQIDLLPATTSFLNVLEGIVALLDRFLGKTAAEEAHDKAEADHPTTFWERFKDAVAFGPIRRKLFGGSAIKESPIGPTAMSGSVNSNLGALSSEQIANYARKAGFSEDKIPIITAISLAESGGNPNAFNPNDPAGGSFGLTQINGIHPGASAARGDPQKAMDLAFQVSGGGRNFSPWSTYTSGAYRAHLGTSQPTSSTHPYYAWPGHAPPGTKSNSKGQPYSASLEHMSAKEAENVKHAMAAIRAGKIYQGSAADVVHNHGNVNFGDINIHTQASSPLGISKVVSDAVRHAAQQSMNGLTS